MEPLLILIALALALLGAAAENFGIDSRESEPTSHTYGVR
jgi:hypothetical protein